jgi:hypothetical protein
MPLRLDLGKSILFTPEGVVVVLESCTDVGPSTQRLPLFKEPVLTVRMPNIRVHDAFFQRVRRAKVGQHIIHKPSSHGPGTFRKRALQQLAEERNDFVLVFGKLWMEMTTRIKTNATVSADNPRRNVYLGHTAGVA